VLPDAWEMAMGGWRDSDGRTASERRSLRTAAERAQLADTIRHRPFSLLKGIAGFALVLVLAFAVIFAMRG